MLALLADLIAERGHRPAVHHPRRRPRAAGRRRRAGDAPRRDRRVGHRRQRHRRRRSTRTRSSCSPPPARRRCRLTSGSEVHVVSEALLVADDVHRVYRLPRTSLFGPRAERHALAGVSLDVAAGDTLGIVGESGSGKSTLARILLGLDRATAGTRHVRRTGRSNPGRPHELRWFRRDVQIVFQDPLSSLDPRMTVADIVAEPLVGLDVPGSRRRARSSRCSRSVGIDPDTATALSPRVLRRPAAAHRHRPGPRAAPQGARRRRAGRARSTCRCGRRSSTC